MFTAFDKTHAHTAQCAPLALMLAGWLGVFLLAAAGCRTARDNQFDVLERELRTQEDYIYELEDYVVSYSEKLRQCRCSQPAAVTTNHSESKSVVKKLKRADNHDRRIEPLRIDEEPLREPGDDSPERREPSRSQRRTPPPRTSEPPAIEPEVTVPEEFEIPDLEISEPLGRVESASTMQLAVYEQNEELVATDDELLLIPEPMAELEPIVQDEQVRTANHRINLWDEPPRVAERVVIAQLFRSEAGEAPPKTLLAVVEARDADDQPVEFSGEVSLMLMASDSEKPLRLKRWDFDPEDAAMAWQSSHLGNGLHLELPLGETKLPEAPLELWVRIVGQEGRKLLAQLPFEREQLAALELETGARELLADRGKQIAEQDPEHTAGAKRGQTLVAETPVADEQSQQKSGWQSATQRTDMDSQGYGSTIKKASGWISQSSGDRFPQTPPRTASRKSQPQWSPRR